MACDAQSLISTAYSNGYAKLSDRDLKMATLASACASGGVTVGAAIPTTAPSGNTTLYVYQQGSSTALYAWDGAAWRVV